MVVTMSSALGIIAVVIAVMATTSALKRHAHSDVSDPSYRVLHPDGWHAAEASDRPAFAGS
jgi:hypothetical protein